MATSPFVLQQMRIYKNKLDEMIDSIKAKRVLLDSVTLFESLVKDKDKLREEIYSLINYFKTKGITAVFTHELPKIRSVELQISEFGIGFLVDGIILLRHVEMGSELKKFITVLKMRGTNHDKSIREFDITSNGIEIQLPFKDYENLMGGSAHRSAYKSVKKFFEK
jgi:circadian clock protein KaiC